MNEIQQTLSTLKDVLSSLQVQMKSQPTAASGTVWTEEHLSNKFSSIDASLKLLSDRLSDLESRVDDIEENSDDSVKNKIEDLEHGVSYETGDHMKKRSFKIIGRRLINWTTR